MTNNTHKTGILLKAFFLVLACTAANIAYAGIKTVWIEEVRIALNPTNDGGVMTILGQGFSENPSVSLGGTDITTLITDSSSSVIEVTLPNAHPLKHGNLTVENQYLLIVMAQSAGVVCDEKPGSLTFQYLGNKACPDFPIPEPPTDTLNGQKGKFTCSGIPGIPDGDTVTITAGKNEVSPSSVTAGESFTISAGGKNGSKGSSKKGSKGGSKLGSQTDIEVGGQSLSIHTSCSKPLATNNIFGSIKLLGFDAIISDYDEFDLIYRGDLDIN